MIVIGVFIFRRLHTRFKVSALLNILVNWMNRSFRSYRALFQRSTLLNLRAWNCLYLTSKISCPLLRILWGRSQWLIFLLKRFFGGYLISHHRRLIFSMSIHPITLCLKFIPIRIQITLSFYSLFFKFESLNSWGNRTS